jgi:hypothetical protein
VTPGEVPLRTAEETTAAAHTAESERIERLVSEKVAAQMAALGLKAEDLEGSGKVQGRFREGAQMAALGLQAQGATAPAAAPTPTPAAAPTPKPAAAPAQEGGAETRALPAPAPALAQEVEAEAPPPVHRDHGLHSTSATFTYDGGHFLHRWKLRRRRGVSQRTTL